MVTKPPPDAYALALQQIQDKNESSPRPGETWDDYRKRMGYEYAPLPGESFEESQKRLEQYYAELPKLKQMAEQGPGLKELAPAYTAFEDLYKPLESYTGIMPYEQSKFDYADTYAKNAPAPYEKTTYDFLDKYQAPEAYTAAQFDRPDVGQLERVSPIAENVWSGREAAEKEKIAQQFADTREQVKQAAIQGQARPEQVAALMANLGVEENKAMIDAQRQLDFQRANQAVGIAQQEQTLGLQRGTTQAQLGLQAQEAQAQEMAKKYGLDIDAARYIVNQSQAQQAAQAAENAQKWGLDIDAAKNLAAQQAAQQTAQAGEQRYGQEWAKGERATAMGLEQAQREAQAAEREKAWQSAYGRSQDVNQQAMADWQAKNAAYTDYVNAQLQGQQAASQQAAQTGTLYSNLTPEERNARNREAGDFNKAQAQQAQPSQTVQSAQKPAGIQYGAAQQLGSAQKAAQTQAAKP